MILILASTFSVDTPNKLPAFPAVSPVAKSPTASTASNTNPVAAPAVAFPNVVAIFLPNLSNTLSEFLAISDKTGSTNLSNLAPNPFNFGNFSTANLAKYSTPSLAFEMIVVIIPFLPAADSAPSPTTLLTALPEPLAAFFINFCSAKLITFPVPSSATSLNTFLDPASIPSLAAFLLAKSITPSPASAEPFLNILLYNFEDFTLPPIFLSFLDVLPLIFFAFLITLPPKSFNGS